MAKLSIELNGHWTDANCPSLFTAQGVPDQIAIREHYSRQGYRVGRIRLH